MRAGKRGAWVDQDSWLREGLYMPVHMPIEYTLQDLGVSSR